MRLSRPSSIPATLLLLSGLYLSQGLPSGLLAHALPALLADADADVRLIGLLKLLALPWFFKFLWAPWVDARGSRRQWILGLQCTAALCLFVLSLLPFRIDGAGLWWLLLLLFCLNALSATQDIATDGLAVSSLPRRWHGPANSVQVAAYKLGLIAGGGGLLLVLAQWGWSRSIQGMAGLLLLLVLPVLVLPLRQQQRVSRASTGLHWGDSLRGFFRQHEGREGLGRWLLVLVSFKVADSLGSAMIKPLLAAQGWNLADMGGLVLLSSVAGLVGAALGGLLYYRVGMRASLLLAGGLQAVGVAAWALLALGLPVVWVYAIAVFEQLADGLSTVALFAVMMAWCRSGHEGSDYTLQASLHMSVAGLGGLLSGFLAHAIGLPAHFLLAGALGGLSLLLVWRLRPAPTA